MVREEEEGNRRRKRDEKDNKVLSCLKSWKVGTRHGWSYKNEVKEMCEVREDVPRLIHLKVNIRSSGLTCFNQRG